MDGQLSFYERERLAFSRFLPQFLLPGPLCYCPAFDYLITCSSAFEVECYKYQTLAAAQAAAEKSTGGLLPTTSALHCIICTALSTGDHLNMERMCQVWSQQAKARSCTQSGSGCLVKWPGISKLGALQVSHSLHLLSVMPFKVLFWLTSSKSDRVITSSKMTCCTFNVTLRQLCQHFKRITAGIGGMQMLVAGAGDGTDIILLGEHSLVVLDPQGQLRLQKRFDYQPVAFATYPVRHYLHTSN